MVNSALSRKQITCRDQSELSEIADKIIAFAGAVNFWIFEGQMGAGKTTLIKAICDKLGVVDNVTSPTFSLVNEYLTEDETTIYHFDFYRIEDEEEAMDIGAEEYFESGEYCFVEWSSKIPNLLPESNFLTIAIELIGNQQRKITLTRHD